MLQDLVELTSVPAVARDLFHPDPCPFLVLQLAVANLAPQVLSHARVRQAISAALTSLSSCGIPAVATRVLTTTSEISRWVVVVRVGIGRVALVLALLLSLALALSLVELLALVPLVAAALGVSNVLGR